VGSLLTHGNGGATRRNSSEQQRCALRTPLPRNLNLVVAPFQGKLCGGRITQGVALGWLVNDPSGLGKTCAFGGGLAIARPERAIHLSIAAASKACFVNASG
jgi:hypothetical protein